MSNMILLYTSNIDSQTKFVSLYIVQIIHDNFENFYNSFTYNNFFWLNYLFSCYRYIFHQFYFYIVTELNKFFLFSN